MGKKPKKKQTDWNIQGKQIADRAVPYYQRNLGRMENYLNNPQRTMENYLNKYYDNTVEQSDFIRNYNRAMSNLTGHNYAATGGGYDTSNQRLYDDQQRYMNDWAARLRDKGIQTSRAMALQDYNSMLAANQAYQNAYALGQPYSDVDQYNHVAGQYNSVGNQMLGLAGGAGKVFSAIPLPWTQAVGAGLQTAGQFALDEDAFAAAAGTPSYRGGGYGASEDAYTNIARGINATAAYGGDNWITRMYGTNNTPASQTLAEKIGANLNSYQPSNPYFNFGR